MNKSPSSKKASSLSTKRPHAEPVANRLADLRKKHGLSQAELAKQVGITRQAVYAIEANQYLPSTQISLQLAEVLNCAVEDLFSLQEKEVVVDAELLGAIVNPEKTHAREIGASWNANASTTDDGTWRYLEFRHAC